MSAPADVGHARHRSTRAGTGARSPSGSSALACAFVFPSRYLILTEIVRLALFALSLDLILGYAGIVSLGHAAFFGVGAYRAGLARHARHHHRAACWRWSPPALPPWCSASLTSFLVHPRRPT